MNELVFLTPEEVAELHREAVIRFGGDDGIRDPGLLESAVLAVQQTFGGEFLYASIYEMTAALWHGIVANHPFIDGNKRAGATAADAFLLVNGIEMTFTNEDIVEITLALATNAMSRAELADQIAQHSRLILS